MLIAIEIGGTKLQLALGREDGTIVKTVRGRVKAEDGAQGILAWFDAQTSALLQEYGQMAADSEGGNGQAEGPVRAIGVGFGGPLETATGTVLKSVQIKGWDNFSLKKWFEDRFGIPTFVFNDSSAAGYGEYRIGSGRGTKQFFYTNIGTGIGGSLIVDGRLYDGQGVGAAELGHTRIPDWTSDQPGKDTELELLCSGQSVEKRLRSPHYIPSGSLLMQLCGGDVSTVTNQMLGEAVGAGDPFALEEIDRVAKSMAIAISNVLCLMQPEVIAVGGGFSLIGDPLIDRIRAHVKERDFICSEGRYRIVPCELGEAIVLQGALLLAAESLK